MKIKLLIIFSKQRVLRWLNKNSAMLLIVPLVFAISHIAIGSGTMPNVPAIILSSDPLYSSASGDKPVLALALSVEFPTVGAQYMPSTTNATEDNSYLNTNEYLGYYDAEGCYSYNDVPTETPLSGQTIADYKRFVRVSEATNRMCLNEFSGNFLNWASSSAIDMLRLALTGGDRYIDTPTLTILQRAVLPHNGEGFPSGYAHFWNSTNFPGKKLLRNGGNFFGAVPQSMVTAAAMNDIWVVNDLNRIYFGISKSSEANSYTLGGPSW